jgi:hypothetical protein
MIKESDKHKFELYVVSLWLLFLLIIVITIDIPILKLNTMSPAEILELPKKNIISIISLICLIFGSVFYSRFSYRIKGSANLPFEVKKIENINYEHLTFLTTYTIPLICFNLTSIRYLITLFVLLIVIGCIYVKTDMFYANPSLAILGYHIYKVKYNNDSEEKNIVLITRDKIKKNDYIRYIKLDETIYYGRIN